MDRGEFMYQDRCVFAIDALGPCEVLGRTKIPSSKGLLMRLLDKIAGLVIANNVAVAIGLFVFNFMEIEIGFIVFYFFVLGIVIVMENRQKERADIAKALMRLKALQSA